MTQIWAKKAGLNPRFITIEKMWVLKKGNLPNQLIAQFAEQGVHLGVNGVGVGAHGDGTGIPRRLLGKGEKLGPDPLAPV